MSDSVQPHRRQPTRLPHPWDSPGKNTGVGCHFLLQCMKVKSESEVVQSCLTLSDPMDCSLPGSPSMGFSGQEHWSGLSLPSLKKPLLSFKYYERREKEIISFFCGCLILQWTCKAWSKKMDGENSGFQNFSINNMESQKKLSIYLCKCSCSILWYESPKPGQRRWMF